MIEKIINALEEESQYSCSHCMARAIEIVQEVAKEYGKDTNVRSNGWIPCSERLPKLTEGWERFKQSECCLTTLEWRDGDMTESIGWYNQSGKWNEDSESCKVIAWQPLPAPYQKGEQKKAFNEEKCRTARHFAACADSYCSDNCNMQCPHEKGE